MSTNGDFVSVMKMDRELITTVSQEFVLQFYTIMNKHPESLHRFYKEESTLVRDDGVAQGQQEIHRYYMKLDLTNCKAIVLSLDAVRSYQKSILIQVTGEIANNGSDLRRFMQSFVLVEQDLGNFYVLNDIFRYQDQTFKVEDIEEAVVEEQAPKEDLQVELNTWVDLNRNCEIPNEQHIIQSNMINPEEERKDEYNFKVSTSEDKDVAVESENDKDSTIQDLNQKMEDVGLNQKSWAAVISPMGGMRTSKPTVPVAPQPQAVKQPVQNSKINSNGDSSFEKRKPRYNAAPKTSNSMNYPDEHQLFVGNLPQNMNERELREFFSSNYGPVKDVRIQKSRSNNDGKPLPNFGFLVFNSHDVVEEILRSKPIYFNSHRLNVEQKQGTRSSQNSRR